MLADGGTAPAPAAPHPGRTTPLMYACSQGDLKQVQKILHDQPVCLHHLDRVHRTPLHYCAGGSTTSPASPAVVPAARLSHCADVLLMAAPDLVHARDQDGFTPLHLAVIAGNVQLVQFLLANGADVKALDGELHSVVHWATVCGETAALQAVLAAGAVVSTPDVHGGYPLHYAAQMCGSEKPDLGLQVLHILLSTPGVIVTVTDNDGRQPLLWAASAGSARAVLALVRAGAAVEAADRDGLTALHCAASRGHTDTLDTLLTLCGAQTDVIDSNGCTALHYSVTLGHADATALLLSHSADQNLQDRKGRSPAHCGCAKGQLETVRQLHASGANLWLRTARGDLPLHEAAASGRRQLVRWLLDQRPSQVNSRNNDGRGLLHLAALNDNADMCKILLDSGAAVNPLLRTSKNVFMTPLDCALQRGFRSTAKFLQLHGGVPASRLNTLRLTSDITAGSHLHIREDITVFGGSSSETDVEDTHKLKDHRGRRKTVRRKLSYRHEKRNLYSASEPEVDSKVRAKSSSKSVHEKSIKKYESERRARSRDDIGKSTKQTDRKKKQEIESGESVSETETSPEMKQDKRRKISEPDKRKQSNEYRNGDATIIPPDNEKKKTKKSHQNDSNHEVSDTEKSGIVISDRERRKSKKCATEEESYEDEKKLKSRSSKNEHEIADRKILKHEDQSSEEKLKKQSSDMESKKDSKSKKSDISDSDTQRNKMSDSERKKKTSAEKKSQKEKSIEENLLEEKQSEEIDTKVKEKTSASKNKLDTQITEQEDLKINDSQTEEKLQQQENKVQKDSDETELTTNEAKSSVEDTSTEAVKDAAVNLEESEDTKHHEEDSEQPSELVQPDQVSLQSKLSEESPSKTIVVEAAVHHLPKGMSTEDIHEELATVTKDNKETTEETLKAETDKVEDGKIVEEKLDDKQNVEDKPEVKAEAKLAKADDDTIPTGENEEKDKVAAVEEAKAPVEESGTTSEIHEVDATVNVEEKVKNESQIEISHSLEENEATDTEIKLAEPTLTVEEKQAADQEKVESGVTEESSTVETKEETSETIEQTTTTETEEQKKDDIDSKKELNIDLSLKKFEESAELQNEATDVDETENIKQETAVEKENEAGDEPKQKKYRKKVKISKSKDQNGEEPSKIADTSPTAQEESKAEEEGNSSSTSRETSSSDSESEKSVKKSKTSETKNSEHKSFKILHDDVAFEVLKDAPVKEHRKVRKTCKKRAKESERLNESATSSPEMLESVRTRSKSVPRQSDSLNKSVTLPSLVEKRPESNLSAPNLSSVYSDNEQKSGSNSEIDDLMSSASRKKRIKKRSKLRVGSKSAGSDYESSNLIDSGFEPSPRSSRIPKRKVMSERGVNMTSVTQQIQSNIRKYHMERKIFQHLLDLKRLQIRSGQANESMLVKRAIDTYHNSVAASVGAGRYMKKDYSYKSFEQFLYQSLRMLQKSPVEHLKGLPETLDNPLLCTQSTHRCLHATHAYTGIPCAAYLPKMNHHTMPKIGFTPRSSSSFLPQINTKGKSVTLELCHGNDKQVISLPADRLDHNKRYYVTFTVKGQEGQSPVDPENTTSHRHAKSV